MIAHCDNLICVSILEVNSFYPAIWEILLSRTESTEMYRRLLRILSIQIDRKIEWQICWLVIFFGQVFWSEKPMIQCFNPIWPLEDGQKLFQNGNGITKGGKNLSKVVTPVRCIRINVSSSHELSTVKHWPALGIVVCVNMHRGHFGFGYIWR